MSFENQIQQWVTIDNEMRNLNEKIKVLRDNRNKLSENIIDYANNKNLTNANSVIKISDGKLKFVNTKIQEGLTFKYLEKSLAEIINNSSQLKLIVEHLKNNRTTKTVQEIKRYSNN
jgi:seryl-tRNA synthetase